MHYFSTAEEAEADIAYDRDLSALLATIIDKESEVLLHTKSYHF